MAKNRKQSTAAPAATTATIAPPPTMQFPAFQPGHLAALAQQMAAGYGGDQATNEGVLSSMYRPVDVPMIARPDQILPYLQQHGIKAGGQVSDAGAGGPKREPGVYMTGTPGSKTGWQRIG